GAAAPAHRAAGTRADRPHAPRAAGAAMSRGAYLELFALAKDFEGPAGPPRVLAAFALSLARGEFVCLLGHSGCGKSTVLAMVAGLSEITSGGIVLDGREIDGPGPDRGVVFQAPSVLPWLSALDNVLLGVDRVVPHGTKAQ